MSGFTTHWYGELAKQEQLIDALWNSLLVGLISAFCATLLGALAARALARYRFPMKRGVHGLLMTPLVMPEVIVATSLLIMFLAIGLDPSLVAVTIGHIFINIPFATAIMLSSFEQFDDSLEEAAVDLGATEWGALRRVTLPVVAPGLLSSLLVSFTVSFDEFILAFFLSGTKPTLPVYIWGQVRFPAKLPIVLALGTLLLVASFLLLIAAEYFRRRAARLTAPASGVYDD
ncbi:MAG: ABC transporter permease [Paracoccaceae bacterium]